MSDASASQKRDTGRRTFGVGAGIAVGVLVFAMLVWAAFSLGFERMQADLSIANKTSLEAEPILTFEADEQGWTLVRPASPQHGTGPEYGNISDSLDALCVFSWTSGRMSDPSIHQAESDEVATLRTLEDEGYESEQTGIVRLVNESGQSIELVYVDTETDSGLDGVVAARTFAGSGDYLMFTMKCEQTGELDQEAMQETLLGVEVHLDLNVDPDQD